MVLLHSHWRPGIMYLFSEESLYGGEISAVILRTNLTLLVR